MKQLKLAERKDLSAKNILKNNRGVTLIELMVTCAIGVFVSMGIASVFIFAMQQFTLLVEKNAAEESALQSSYYLTNYLSQAVDLNAVSVVNPATLAAGGGTGQINIKFDMLNPALATDYSAPDTGQFARFAIFNREAGRYNANSGNMVNINNAIVGTSDLRRTGIFIKDTNSVGLPDSRSGAIVFDFNTADGSPLMPEPSDLFFSRIHNVRIQRVTCNGVANGFEVEVVVNHTNTTNPLHGTVLPCVGPAWTSAVANQTFRIKTITLEVMTRYFKSSDKSSWNFRSGSTTGVAAVAAEAPYRDIVQTVKINFKNNVLTSSSLVGGGGTEERVHGSMYFYDYVIPSLRN